MSQKESYITTKKSVLSSQGLLYNDLYYSIENSNAALVESTSYSGISRHSLNAPRFSSTSTVFLQNEGFISNMWLHLELPSDFVIGGNNINLCQGWGYFCIEEIQYTLGASSSTFTISGEGMLLHILNQIKDEQKKNFLIERGGQRTVGNARIPLGGGTPLDITADVFIGLPFSTMCQDSLPFPIDCLSSNVQVSIKFKSPESIQRQVSNNVADVAVFTEFTQAFIHYRETTLTDKSMSLRYDLLRDQSLMYNYPFIFSRSFRKTFAGLVRGGAQKVSIDLQGFLNADLLGISFYLVKSGDEISQGNLQSNPGKWQKPESVELLYNGQIIYRSEYHSWMLQNIFNDSGENKFDYPSIGINGTDEEDHKSHFVTIDFSRIRSACTPSMLQNTFRLSNQNLELRLHTYDTDNYTLHGIFMYNGICSIQGGVSQIYFD